MGRIAGKSPRWAAEVGAYLIEDDHGSEFRYRGRPIPALKEMDSSDSVIHIGTFSRAIAPASRAGYMELVPDNGQIIHTDGCLPFLPSEECLLKTHCMHQRLVSGTSLQP